MTMSVIEHIEVGAGGLAEIEFSSIPATYTDLMVVMSLRSEGAQSNFGLKFNGSTADFTNRWMYGTGSSAASSTVYNNFLGVGNSTSQTANTFSSHTLYVPNYAGSTNKSWSVDAVNENNATEAYQTIVAGLWSQTTAISSLAIYQLNANDVGQYSSATLFGITAGSDGTTTVS